MNLLDFIYVSYAYIVPLNWESDKSRWHVNTFKYLHKNSGGGADVPLVRHARVEEPFKFKYCIYKIERNVTDALKV